MKKIIVFTIAIIAILGFSRQKKSWENKMTSFSWLEGSWTMKTKRGSIMETWTALNDSTIGGESMSFSVSGQSKILENLQLAYRDNAYYYISKVNGQNNNQAVRFKITSSTENSFVAENPEHDFPKRITYKMVNKDSVHAFIDGGPSQADKKSDFYYSRYKN